MRSAVIGGVKPAAVVRNGDLTAGICFPCPDGNVKGAGIGIPAVFDGVLHDGLQRQRRHAEADVRRIVIDEKAVFILGLLDSEVGAHMLKLGGEGDGL